MKKFILFLKKLLSLFYAEPIKLEPINDELPVDQFEEIPYPLESEIIKEQLDKNSDIMEAPKLDISAIIFHAFPENQFVKRITNKTQATIHHTVSGRGVKGDIGWWLSQPARIATHFIIGWDGVIHQNYSTKYWGYHLGCGKANLDACTIAIEIDSWGGLVMNEKTGLYHPARWDKKKGKFMPNLRVKALEEDRVFLVPDGYRGFTAFENYTTKAIESLRQILVYCNEKYGIPIDYREDMWDWSADAMAGNPGVYSHTSYRKDKSDIYPHPKLVEMLKNPYVEVA